MSKLKSCPFCGADASYIEVLEIDYSYGWAVRCDRCMAYGPTAPTRDGAIIKWGTRA